MLAGRRQNSAIAACHRQAPMSERRAPRRGRSSNWSRKSTRSRLLNSAARSSRSAPFLVAQCGLSTCGRSLSSWRRSSYSRLTNVISGWAQITSSINSKGIDRCPRPVDQVPPVQAMPTRLLRVGALSASHAFHALTRASSAQKKPSSSQRLVREDLAQSSHLDMPIRLLGVRPFDEILKAACRKPAPLGTNV